MILPDILQKPCIRAAFYGRFSTKDQKIDTQQSMCESFAEEHNMTIVKEYIDENFSGFRVPLHKRKQIEALREDARCGEFDCVLIYKADRLARRIDQHMVIWSEFRELQIPIIIVESEKLYTTDNPNEIIVEIGLSSFESENTRTRTRDNYNKYTEDGKWLGGFVPYGYEYDEDDEGNKIIIQIHHEVEIVKQIFKAYKEGYGFKRVAKIINEDNSDLRFTSEKIKAIVTNPFYAGYTTSQRLVPGSGNSIQPRDDWKMGKSDKIPPCISEELWEECMELYEKKRQGVGHHDQVITPYWFKGIIKCDECDEWLKTKNYTPGKKRKDGSPYHKPNGESWRKYICPNCQQKWDAEKLQMDIYEYAMEGWYFQYHNNREEELQKQFELEIEQDLKTIDKSIKNLKQDISKYHDQLLEGERKQQELMQINPEIDELKEALVQYRISLQKKIELLEQSIKAKEKEKEELHLAYLNRDRFSETVRNLTEFKYDFNEPHFRKLMLYLFKEIKVKDDYTFSFEARVDLSQRGEIRLGIPTSLQAHQDEDEEENT